MTPLAVASALIILDVVLTLGLLFTVFRLNRINKALKKENKQHERDLGQIFMLYNALRRKLNDMDNKGK